MLGMMPTLGIKSLGRDSSSGALNSPCLRSVFGAFAILCAFFVPLIASASAPVADVKSIRVGEHPSYTRIVIEATAGIGYTVFALENPNRIVIDVSEVAFKLPRVPKGVGLISDIRFGQFRPGTSRVVLETSKPTQVTRSFALAPDGRSGHRVAIDLKAVSQSAFQAQLNRPLAAGTPNVAPRTPNAAPRTQRQSQIAAAPSPTRRPASATPLTIVGTANAAPAQLQSPTLQTSNPARATGTQQVAALPSGVRPGGDAIRAGNGKPTIVLDAGHGGVDPGAIGRRGTKEKDITLSMARELRKILKESGRYNVALTRESDKFIKLRERIVIGEELGGDVFVSIHADSINSGRIRGVSVYTLSTEASDREAAALAARENKADLLQSVDLSQFEGRKYLADILLDMSLDGQMKESNKLAHIMTEKLGNRVRLLPNAKRSAGFAVLKSPNMTSVLVELGYISNKKEENLLKDPRHRRKLGTSILEALDAFFAPQ